MELPSRELLSAILGFKVTKIVDIQQDSDGYEDYEFGTIMLFNGDGRHHSKINIYELMHMMKVWAYDSGMPLTIIWANHIVHVRIGEKRFYANEKDEYDGVRQACEWILTQKENNEQA